MISIKNDIDTSVKFTNQEGNCQNCNYICEIIEVTYTTWKQLGEYLTPNKTQTDKICDNCFDEDY